MDSATIAALVMGFVLGPVMLASGVLIDRTAERGASGDLGPNRIAGIRTKATLSSDEAWLAGHSAGLRLTKIGAAFGMASGAAVLMCGILTALGAWSGETGVSAITVALFFGVVGMTGFVVAGAVAGNRAARAVEAASAEAEQ